MPKPDPISLLDPAATPVKELLVRWRSGDKDALQALMPLVYDEMRRLAHRYLRRERPGHTLRSTTLVHEAFVRLTGDAVPQWEDRVHFFGIASHLMRQIVVEYARSRNASKRGGAVVKLAIYGIEERMPKPALDIVALDDALNDLARIDPQQSRVVELRFFSGLSIGRHEHNIQDRKTAIWRRAKCQSMNMHPPPQGLRVSWAVFTNLLASLGR